MPEISEILVIMSGGTIAAESYKGKPTPKRVTVIKNDSVEEAIKNLPGGDNCRFYNFGMKDSNDINSSDLKELARIIKEDQRQKFIITCGTDKMADCSRILKKLLKGTNKTVVFTGAMVPLSHGEESDGNKNLRTAMEFIKRAKAGVYVAMNQGKDVFYAGENLRKNFEKKIFYGTKVPESSMNRKPDSIRL